MVGSVSSSELSLSLLYVGSFARDIRADDREGCERDGWPENRESRFTFRFFRGGGVETGSWRSLAVASRFSRSAPLRWMLDWRLAAKLRALSTIFGIVGEEGLGGC